MNPQPNQPPRTAAFRTAGPKRESELPLNRPACTRRLCVPQLISAKAAADPYSDAIVSETGRMSYAELDRRSDRLAGYLVGMGVGRDQPVALCLERSFDYIVSALAIWKSGGAYLPMDPAWPLEQRNYVVKHSGARVLITRGTLESEAPLVIDVDRDRDAIDRAAAIETCEARRDDLAYIIYTSGTTGKPKGVEITHGNLLNFVFWSIRTWTITPADRSAHVLGTAFDASIADLWPFLIAGATIVLPEESVRTSPELLRDWILRQQITMINVPSVLAEPLIQSSWPAATALRWLTSGGDTLRCYPPSTLPFGVVNHYGPTECTVTATAAIIPSVIQQNPPLPPIGKPIANATVYLLDENLQPAPVGAIGEMFIGGTGVGRGYRNQPDLTDDRFVDDPFSARPGARMYRTGDLGVLLADGQIAFRGRADNQEKIRGHRIELDGIGAVLTRHPDVESCAVIARGEGEDRRLVAYVVPKTSVLPDSTELRDFVAKSLPEYMVPAAFVKLDALPLTINGKLDRTALPEPRDENLLPVAAFEAPDSPIEKQLAAVLASLLNTARIGRNDNFFLLGGHSLLATRVVLQVRERFGIELRMRQVMTAQTLATLGSLVEEALLAKVESLSDEEAAQLLSRLEA